MSTERHFRLTHPPKAEVSPLDTVYPPEVATPLPDVYYADPEPGESTYMDTMGLQFDRLLALIQGTESFFDNNPNYHTYTYVAELPSDDLKADRRDYTYPVTRANSEDFKRMAADRYMDLRDHSSLGHELAQDIAKSWQPPEGYELPIDEEVKL